MSTTSASPHYTPVPNAITRAMLQKGSTTRMPTLRFDAIVIGAGQAGPPLVARLTKAGMKVALAERHLFGGTCVNNGCIPTKTYVACARGLFEARRTDLGYTAANVTADLRAIKARKDDIIARSRTGVEKALRDNPDCTVFHEAARFLSPTELEVGDTTISAQKIFLNVGARASVPDLPGVHDIPFLTNTSILELETLPAHLVIIGGSYIACEFAQMFRRFGSAVTIVEKTDRLISKADPDVSACTREILEAEGITVRTSAECIHFRTSPDGTILVGTTCTTDPADIPASHVLLALGRTPNTADLGLDKAGLASDNKGYLTVDDQLRTNVPGIWAMGECNGHSPFTHAAYNDYEIVADHLPGGGAEGGDRAAEPSSLSNRFPCYAMYIDPPLGQVGLTETEARASGRKLLIANRPMTRVNRAVEKGETRGFLKAYVDADTKKILGATFLGTGCDEVIHSVLYTMYADAPYTAITRAMPIHPTVSELLPSLFESLEPAK